MGWQTGFVPKLKTKVGLAEEERRQLITFGVRGSARALGISASTYRELIDPHGLASPQTVERIRERLAALREEGKP